MRKRILVVEDDSIQQALIQSALEQRGFVVDKAADGLEALKKIRSTAYDVALVDYRLPEIDGLAAARLARELLDQDEQPRLIAITADQSDLEQRTNAREIFDAILAKPFDLQALLRLVENYVVAPPNMSWKRSKWLEVGLDRVPTAKLVPSVSQSQEELLNNYFNLDYDGVPDVLLLTHPDGLQDLEDLRSQGEMWHRPAVDLTGQFPSVCDAQFVRCDHREWQGVATVIGRFDTRYEQLADRARRGDDLGTRLLSYMAMSGRDFSPASFPSSKHCVHYNGLFSSHLLAAEMIDLCAKGHVERAFADRMHVCPCCTSARLSVREECASCRCADLTAMPILHHYRCAHQALEEEFVDGRELICPKCRQMLRHYGSDYDKSGVALVCGECGKAHSDAAVGFKCLDCGSHTDGEAIRTHDIYSYSLTDAGFAAVTASRSRSALAKNEWHLPQSLVSELHRKAELPDAGNVVSLAEIRYAARDEYVRRLGLDAFESARDIFMQNLKGCAAVEIETFASPNSDYVLSTGDRAALKSVVCQYSLDTAQHPLLNKLSPDIAFIDVPLRASHVQF